MKIFMGKSEFIGRYEDEIRRLHLLRNAAKSLAKQKLISEKISTLIKVVSELNAWQIRSIKK